MIAARLSKVREQIAAAAVRCGRAPSDVHLIAVSKRQPVAAIRAAYAAGQRDFGESYVQELREKASSLADLSDLRWHFIGRIQTNKAKWIGPLADRVHAVTSARHARAVAARAEHPVSCLIAVNLADEPSKGGVAPDEALGVARALHREPMVALCGLMTLPPEGGDPGAWFGALAALATAGRDEGLPLVELSMGMSGDFESAITHGATWVRVGTAIFGERV